MADEKKRETPANPVAIPMKPVKKRRSHETQMLTPLSLIDPDLLLDGAAQALTPGTPAPINLESVDALLPATSSQEIDLLFADVLPSDETKATQSGSSDHLEGFLGEAPLEDLASTPEPLLSTDASLEAAQAPTKRDPSPIRQTDAYAPEMLLGSPPPKPPKPPTSAVTPGQRAIGDAIFDVLSQQQATHEQAAGAPTSQDAALPDNPKAARAEAAETFEEIVPRPTSSPAVVAVASADTERDSAVQEALLAAQAPTEADVAKTQASAPLISPGLPEDAQGLEAIAASLDAAQNPTEVTPARPDVAQTRAAEPMLPGKERAGRSLDNVATLVEGATALAPLPQAPKSARPSPAPKSREGTPPRAIKSSMKSSMSSALKPSPALRLTHLPFISFPQDTPALKLSPEPRYELLKLLDSNATTEHYLVKDNDLQRLAVLKRLKPEHHTEAAMARFVEHIQHIGQLNHPAIPPIHDVGVDAKSRYYYVEKYVGGETLDVIIEKLSRGEASYHKRFNLSARLEIITTLLHALRFAHAQGIVHRDLTPSCVVIGPYGDVHLQGWELAQQQRNRPSHAKVEPLPANLPMPKEIQAASPFKRLIDQSVANVTLTGTPAYMAPERLKDAEGNEGSDIYSLCAIAYEFLTLRHYLNAERTHFGSLLTAIAKKEPAAPKVLGGASGAGEIPIPARVAGVLLRGLAKDPAERPSKIAEIYLTLQEPPRSTKRSPLTLTLMGLCVAFAAYGLMQLFFQLWGMWMVTP